MRVLFAITRGEIGGAQEHLRILATGLLARGHSVGLAAEEPSMLTEAISAAGAESLKWNSIERDINPFADVRARRELRQIVRSYEPDVIHLHSSKAGLLGRRLVRPPKGIVLQTCHHAPYGPGRRWTHRILARPIDQVALPYLDGILSVGARDMPLLRKLAPDVPIRLVRNAVPFEGTPPRSPERPVPVALWVARMRHPKDPIQAVTAWEKVVRVRPDACLIMCGEGPLLGALRKRVARSPAADNIEVLGRVPDVALHHARASIYLLATDVEGGNTMATLEAMTNGLVPVMNDAGDAFLIEHARAGIVVARRSPRAMAHAVLGLMNDPERLLAMRQRALTFSREDWTVEDFVDATVDFYMERLARTCGRAPDEPPREPRARK